MTRFSKSPLMLGATALAAMALGMSLLSSPVKAEESMGETTIRATGEAANARYDTFVYPNLTQAFYLAPEHEVRFDIHNAKFFKLEYNDARNSTRGSSLSAFRIESVHAVSLDLEVEFFTPRGEKIASMREFRPNWWFAVPHNDTSLEYERLQVRIRNHSSENRDFRIVAINPVNAVKGTPIPKRHDLDI